jgi:hypothetical protein
MNDTMRQGLEVALLKAVSARLRALEAQPLPRDGEQGEVGPRGEQGPPGPKGDIGPMPRHEWNGTELRFQLAPDRWGAWVDLKGDKGDKGEDGKSGGTAVVGGGSIRIFSLNLPGFVPAPGAGGATKFLRGDATWQTVTGSGTPQFSYMPSGWQ